MIYFDRLGLPEDPRRLRDPRPGQRLRGKRQGEGGVLNVWGGGKGGLEKDQDIFVWLLGQNLIVFRCF